MKWKVFAFMLVLTLTTTWLSVNTTFSQETGQILRVFTVTVSPDKRDQLSTVVNEITESISEAKGVLWFKVGTDPATGAIAAVMLWNSPADLDAFLKSDSRNARGEKVYPLLRGEPSAKNYQVVGAKK